MDSVSARVLPLPGYHHVPVPADLISYDSEIVMTYIQEFADLAQVPHASHLTGPITQYLLVWAKARGVACEADEWGNVVMSIPAAPGFENAPVVGFQAHIDMVPATDESVCHDWAKDPLKLIWSKNEVTADGTTLGADNCAGVAFMQTYIDFADRFAHGPMKFFYTVDEEVGLLGAHRMDARFFADGDYLVNVDGGAGGAIISCAGGKYFTFSREAKWEATDGAAMAIEFAGLQGGHSAGVGGGKANGLVAMANALLTLQQAGIAFGIASFAGGNANNAIPKESKAVICLAKAEFPKATALLEGFAKRFRDSYEAVEKEYTFAFGECAAPEKVLTQALSAKLVQLMSAVPNNIHTLLATASGTESSSNLGMIDLGGEKVSFTCFMRSSSTYQSEQITMINTALAELTGFTLDIPMTMATWPLKAENRLSDIAAALWKEMNGTEFRLEAIHAGVECGELAEKNPAMCIISTGLSGGSGAHTTAEKLSFDNVEKDIAYLVSLAERLAKED